MTNLRRMKMFNFIFLACIIQLLQVPGQAVVRLVGDSRNYIGRVEFYHEGKWGTICEKRWDTLDGTVVCRLLGFASAKQVFKGAHFGGGNGTIRLTKLGCYGNESSLLDCKNAKANLGKSDCTHQQDAGVECDQTPVDHYCNYGIPKLLTKVGSFHSPKYPDSYPNKVICRWTIQIPQDIIEQENIIKLTFVDFKLEIHSTCLYDSVVIYDGDEGSNSSMLGKFCGEILPSPVYASKGKMTVTFISDETVPASGFNATFEFSSDLVEPEIQSITTDQSVLRGSSVKLRCSANGVPAPTVVWTKNGSDVVLIKEQSTAILFLKNVTKQHHEGVYHCAINNTEGSDDADVNVKVVVNQSKNRTFIDLKNNKETCTNECPPTCTCFSEIDELQVECKVLNLTSVPLGIPDSVRELDLSDNFIENLTTYNLKSLTLLQRIYLSNNRITKLQRKTFQDTNSLEEIFLARNKIQEIEPGSFDGLEESLIILFLSSNSLTSLTTGLFTNLTSLQYLFLSDNKITTVDSYTFSGLAALELMDSLDLRQHIQNFRDLADNPIKKMNHFAFSINNSALHTIYLMNTELQKMNHNAFHGQKDVHTYISPEHVTDGFVTNKKGLFIALTEAGFADGNTSHRFPCPTGTYVPHLKNFKYSTAIKAKCLPCPPGGFYSNRVAQVGALCFLCNPGTFVPPERAPGRNVLDCTVCPTGTITSLRAGFRACKCIRGFHRVSRFGHCESCPSQGLECVNESVSLKKGYYWQWDSEVKRLAYEAFAKNLEIEDETYLMNTSLYNGTLPKPYQCPRVKSCEGGLESKCATGYSGPLCEVCQNGYYKRVLACKACPSGTWVIVQLCLCGAAVLVLIIILIWSGRRKKTSEKRPMIDILLARLKIVIGFYQVTSGIVEAFVYVKWPSSLSMIGDYAEVIQLNILQFVPLHCLFPSWKQDAFSKMYFLLGSNAGVATLAFVGYWIRKLFLLGKFNSNSSKMRAKLSTTKEFLYRNVFLFLFITYPSTCSAILRTFPLACHKLCTGSSCTLYLKADYSVKCEGEKYHFFKLFAFGASSYVVVLPGLVLIALWRQRRKQVLRNESGDEEAVGSNRIGSEFDDVAYCASEITEENDEVNGDDDEERPNEESELISGMSFLYENYKDDAWYWELVEVVRKLVLTCGIILIGRESRAYVGLASICSGLFAIFYAFRKPIRDEFEDKLQLTSLLVIFLNLGIGVILKIPKESVPSDVDQYVDSLLVNILVVGANVLVIVLVVGRYLAVLIHNFMLWRKNPQCSATCCITMLLSLNELTSGVNSVASMRKTNFRTNLGMGGVDMPSMRSAVNDNVGFEIEDKEEEIKSKKDKVTDTRGVRFTDAKGPTDEMLSNNIIRRGIPEGRRFSSRFPARQIRALNS